MGSTPPSWTPVPEVSFDVDLPARSRYVHAPPAITDRGRILMDAVVDKLPSFAIGLADAVRERTDGRFQEEVEAQAEIVGVDWRTLVLANLGYDLSLSVMGCSVAALDTPTGPAMARNLDWFPAPLLARTTILVHATRGADRLFSLAGWPGTVGAVTGCSDRGFALALNAVRCPERQDLGGYPVTLHLRRVLEDAEGFDHAVEMVAQERLVVGCLVTLVGSEPGQRVVVERSPKRHALRRARPGEPLVVSNHYETLHEPRACDSNEIYRTTLDRAEAMRDLLGTSTGESAFDSPDAMALLAHPRVHARCTAQQVFMQPASGRIDVNVPSRHLTAEGAAVAG